MNKDEIAAANSSSTRSFTIVALTMTVYAASYTNYNARTRTWPHRSHIMNASGSGYYIREYPPGIVSKAIHILAHSRGAPVEQVAAQFGMRILGRDGGKNRVRNANER